MKEDNQEGHSNSEDRGGYQGRGGFRGFDSFEDFMDFERKMEEAEKCFGTSQPPHVPYLLRPEVVAKIEGWRAARRTQPGFRPIPVGRSIPPMADGINWDGQVPFEKQKIRPLRTGSGLPAMLCAQLRAGRG